MSSVVSTQTGSDLSIDDIVWVSRTGDTVGCASTGWTGGVECGDYGGGGGTVSLTRTGSDESVTGVICPTGPEGLVDWVAASGTGKEGCHVYVRDIAWDICEGCCLVDNVACAPQPGNRVNLTNRMYLLVC